MRGQRTSVRGKRLLAAARRGRVAREGAHRARSDRLGLAGHVPHILPSHQGDDPRHDLAHEQGNCRPEVPHQRHQMPHLVEVVREVMGVDPLSEGAAEA